MLARAIAAAIGRFYSDAMHYEVVASLQRAYGPRFVIECEVFPPNLPPDTDCPWIVFDANDDLAEYLGRFATEAEARTFLASYAPPCAPAQSPAARTPSDPSDVR